MLQDELNRNPFTVPENYFDRLPMLVQERYSATKSVKKESKIWAAVKPRLAYIGGFGALALLAYGGATFIGNNALNTNNVATNNNGNKVIPISANSFINNNSKSYAQFTNTTPFIFATDKSNTKSQNTKIEMDEDIMDYLAIENISVDDILGLE